MIQQNSVVCAKPHGVGRLCRGAGKVEAKFWYVLSRRIQEGQSRGGREEKKERNHSALCLATSLIVTGDATGESKSWGPGFLLPGLFVFC